MKKKEFKVKGKLKCIMENIKEVIKNGFYNLNGKFKIAITDKRNEIEQKLEELCKDKDSVFCSFCKEHLSLDQIRGLYKYGNEVIIFCDKTSCQMNASHRFLELESKFIVNGKL